MKISIIGAGNVGSTSAFVIAQKKLCDNIILVDILDSVKGKALDIQQAASCLEFETKIEGGTKYEMIAKSDIIINTAGFARNSERTSREDLLEKNLDIAKTVCSAIKKYAPKAIVMNVANPVDSITYGFYKMLNGNHQKIFGMGGLLDCSRAEALIAKETNFSITGIKTKIIGSHGDDMVFLKSHGKIYNDNLAAHMKKKRLESIIIRTKKSGSEIVDLLGQSGYIAPSVCVANQVEAVAKNTKSIFCLPAYLDGEYGHKGLYIGVPAVLGRSGVEKIIELDLNKDERNQFEKSVKNAKEMARKVDNLL